MMKTHTLAAVALLAGFGLSTAGCEASLTAETAEEYTGTESVETIEWVSGQDLQVDGRNGQIDIVPGVAGEVSVTFKPFTFRGPDEEAEAAAEMEGDLQTSVTEDAAGAVFVEARATGGSSSLGAKMVIAIPPEFDAGIFIEQGNGDVEIATVGQAVELAIVNEGVGDCVVQGNETVIRSKVWCSAVSLTGVSGYVNVQADGLDGNAAVEMASVAGFDNGVPDGESKNVIYTEDGDIVLTVPADEDYVVQAYVQEGGGVVNTGSVPTTCTQEAAAEGSKTVTCGTGPLFDVVAGLDQLGDPVNIEIAYR